ncbi:ATPase, T2SS/T4P/T4SS family [Sulfoacidibacillus thermotolerans]|uniref:Bacterial type II secretion system protein E domain-containing protein n=1 Tax=Sulfoacidibacillus thermotolerans TaxID=1765684 RepID=A0A2U3D5M0_SULT2|nr:ATPase, T2SS/T4P/T4SS family [Sulfoacidibacillus thermotolerans]PWI56571.1 hypothetical protein BM613_13060 [Sulfoacidibacillus thermotolerans]PWI56591.1 hypothetical protein BM613_12880 [Sulfoacidibacillus thermotolerans]
MLGQSKPDENLLRVQKHTTSKEVAAWKERLVTENKRDQEFLSTLPKEQEMEIQLAKIARKIGVPDTLRAPIIEELLEDIYEYGVLTELKSRPKVTTIWVAGNEWIEYAEGGKIKTYPKRFASIEEVYRFIEKKLAGTSFRYARNIPEIDAILADGSRFHVMQGSAGVSRTGTEQRVKRIPLLTIRLFSYPYALHEIVTDNRLRTYLEWLPKLGASFVIAGNQGAGKTTTLNAMSAFVSPDHRLILIEEAPEMQPLFPSSVIRLWNQGELGNVHFVNMIKNNRATLRMGGDVMMIGEIRDEDTLWEFLRISNVGLHLVAATLHANSAQDALLRMQNLGMAVAHHPPRSTVADMIQRGISHVIFLRREAEHMGIEEVLEITGQARGQVIGRTVFSRDVRTGEVTFHGLSKEMKERAMKKGVLTKEWVDN